ncbi:BrnA antitoxin family protein [Shimia sp. W99]
MPETRRLTKTQRIARDTLTRNLVYLNSEIWLSASLREDIPDAWHTLEQDVDVQEPKEKVTLYLDKSVARFYRAMGKGYQERINRLLATWAQMKIADELRIDELIRARFDDDRIG